MKKAIPFRMAAALSLYFSVLCALPVLDGHTEVMAFGLALGFLGLCAYVRFPHPAVRIIASRSSTVLRSSIGNTSKSFGSWPLSI